MTRRWLVGVKPGGSTRRMHSQMFSDWLVGSKLHRSMMYMKRLISGSAHTVDVSVWLYFPMDEFISTLLTVTCILITAHSHKQLQAAIRTDNCVCKPNISIYMVNSVFLWRRHNQQWVNSLFLYVSCITFVIISRFNILHKPKTPSPSSPMYDL